MRQYLQVRLSVESTLCIFARREKNARKTKITLASIFSFNDWKLAHGPASWTAAGDPLCFIKFSSVLP